jgi:hypothetical protein
MSLGYASKYKTRLRMLFRDERYSLFSSGIIDEVKKSFVTLTPGGGGRNYPLRACLRWPTNLWQSHWVA